MSEQPAATPAETAPAATASAQESTAVTPETPPWGDDFDAEKAWKLVQNLRSDKEKLASRQVLTPEQETKLTEYDRLVEAAKSDLEKAQEAAAKNEARATSLLTRAVKAEVKALAASGFADPDDAATALDPSKYATPEGDVDTEAIKADLADLLTRKPHWAKAATTPGMKPNPAQGRSASPPATAAERIAAAEKAGDLRTVLRLKAEQAMND